jgi:4-amino-4-deoxy-L-arabinose transferase-like glycosyltransferase
LILFALALAVRIAFLWWRGPLLFFDTADYLQLAENLRSHHVFSLSPTEPFVPTIYRPPLYPAVIALLGGPAERELIAVIQAILDACVCVCVFRLARTFASARTSLLAAVAYALHPGAIVASASLLTESLFGFLSVVGVLLLVNGLRGDRLPMSLLAGVSLGLAALSRSIGAAVPLIFVLAILKWRWTPRPRAHAALMLLAALGVMTPWIVRSSALARSFVLIQAPGVAMNFYLPTRTDLDQSNAQSVWTSFFTSDTCGQALLRATTAVEISEVNRHCMREALDNIRRAPLRYVLSRLQSFPHLVLTSFDSFTGINQSFGASLRNRAYGRFALKLVLLLLFSACPFILALAGLRGAPVHAAAGLAAAVWIFTFLIHIPMWIESRFWQPAVPFLMVNAAMGWTLGDSLRSLGLRGERL